MRFIRQPDYISCGPTAILNVMRWLKMDVPSAFIHHLKFACRTYAATVETAGTYDSDFDRVLRYSTKGVATIRKEPGPTASDLRAYLTGGEVRAIAFSYYAPKLGHHYAFIAGFEKGRFIVVNDHESKISRRTMRTMARWLKHMDDSPCAWLISPLPAPLTA